MSGVVRSLPLRAPRVVTRQTGAPRMNLLPIRPPLALNSAVLITDMIRTATVPNRSSLGVQGRGFVSAIASPRRAVSRAAQFRILAARAHDLLSRRAAAARRALARSHRRRV